MTKDILADFRHIHIILIKIILKLTDNVKL